MRFTSETTPNDLRDLAEVERRLLAFQRRYQQTAMPFDWRFTRADLARLLHRLDQKPVEIGYPAPSLAPVSSNGGRKTFSVPVWRSNSLRCWVTMSVP
jgi:hypothetical protein